MKTLKNPLLIAIFAFFTIVFTTACSKDEEAPPPSTKDQFTSIFTGNYINPQLDAIIFLSDMQGHLLADTMVSGNGVFQLGPKAGGQYPSNFMVTIATWEPYVHNFIIKLNTYYHVSSKSWLFQGNRAEIAGHASVTLKNVPEHQGPVLFSNSGFSNLTFNTTGRVCDLFITPDDLYIQIKTTEGSRYKWVEGIANQGSYEVDMSQTEVPVSQTITFPQEAVYYEARVTGYKDYDTQSPLYYLVDEVLGDGTPASSFVMSGPALKFATFHTNISMITDWDSPLAYHFWTDGVIPSEFKKIDATVSTFEQSPGRISYTSTGVYNVSNASWKFSATNNQIFEWNVYAADSVKELFLPEMPLTVQQTFPVLKVDSLSLSHIQLMNFFWLTSYQDVLKEVFITNPTTSMEHLEAGTVTYTPVR
jgi:hypothetical protein